MSNTAEKICYCFNVTAQMLAADAQAGEPYRHFRAVQARCARGEARCAELNPSGRCCLSVMQARIAACAGAQGETPAGRNCCGPSPVIPEGQPQKGIRDES